MSKKSYEVGNRKPPRHTQFPKGTSGNPAGRPIGSKNLKTDLVEELGERVAVTENGKPLKLSKQRLMIKALMGKAIKGDPRSADILLKLIGQVIGTDSEDRSGKALAPEDQAILDAFLGKKGSTGQGQGSADGDPGNKAAGKG